MGGEHVTYPWKACGEVILCCEVALNCTFRHVYLFGSYGTLGFGKSKLSELLIFHFYCEIYEDKECRLVFDHEAVVLINSQLVSMSIILGSYGCEH